MNVALNEIIFNKKIVLCPTTRLDLFSIWMVNDMAFGAKSFAAIEYLSLYSNRYEVDIVPYI